MYKSVVSRRLQRLAWLSIAAASCNVYDPALTHRLDSSAREASTSSSIDAGAMSARLDLDAGELDERSMCGDGVLDPSERCDVAIASGEVGACPDGCSGRDGCVVQKMIGRDCQAHCEAVTIDRPIPNDGCCPAGAAAKTDPDCASTCGNGLIEPGEHCDPPETCVVAEACVSHDACTTSEYSGDPEQCTASCNLRPVEGCVSGDGCCPPGCNADRDHDCPSVTTAPASGPMACDAGCDAADGGGPEAACASAHQGGDCEACDCAHCQDATMACDGASGSDGELCNAVVACAAEAHCTGMDCYCGAVASSSCVQAPRGPCVTQMREAAGTSNVVQLIALGMLDTGALGRAIAMLSCRKSACANECSLTLTQ